jgi:protein-S-isoprenylcysteine O-methyltransferase Ste14
VESPETRTPSRTDWWAYCYALAPIGVVLCVGPILAAIGSGWHLGPIRWAGVPTTVAGLGLVGLSLRAFARAGQTPSPVERPERLVTSGPLSRTRNPIYLGTVLAAAGEAILLSSILLCVYAATLWGVYHLIVVYVEEPKLRSTFGEDFDRYCRRVPRWI